MSDGYPEVQEVRNGNGQTRYVVAVNHEGSEWYRYWSRGKRTLKKLKRREGWDRMGPDGFDWAHKWRWRWVAERNARRIWRKHLALRWERTDA